MNGKLTPAQVGVIFDLDNTLIGSHIDFVGMRQAVVSQLEQAGISLSAEEKAWTVGRLAALADKPELQQLKADLWETINAFEVAGMVDAVLEPGAMEALTSLRKKGHPLAVVTNNARVSAMKALQDQELLGFFVAVFARDDVALLKPAPDGLVAARVALGNPKFTVMVGDSWLDGVAAAAAEAFFIAVGDIQLKGRDVPIWRSIATLSDLAGMDLPTLLGRCD